MNFSEAVKSGLHNFVNFSGRASRSEFWWFYLFTTILTNVSNVVFGAIGLPLITILISFALLVAVVSAGARRLHDIGRSGWWQLLGLTGIGIILLIYWAIQKGDEGDNEYGPPALNGAQAISSTV